MASLDPKKIPVLSYAPKTLKRAKGLGFLTDLGVIGTAFGLVVTIHYGIIFVHEIGSRCGTAIASAESLIWLVVFPTSLFNLAVLITSALISNRDCRQFRLIIISTVLNLACLACPIAFRYTLY